ncbi:hypothetical protein HNV11_23530 [Spirosoma taeanense]|uniref:Uncharacterized protein n=1 Tax=Spirosoma taeanense TaxID=2735870 RepID=A0A6M5YDP1_9BACT|nr:hypothetical protein [Spirosoma taeanense]QJW92137.1 hypothetical protein HNV11_23530 [Spirosoma taeanense]
MSKHTDDLKAQIEHVLRWESSFHWRKRDFTLLSEQIWRHTQERVPTDELQAFWQSSTIPPSASLDSLARFVDYLDWADFCQRNRYGAVEADDETRLMHGRVWEIPMRWVIVICWLSVVASILVGVLLLWKR